jgi:MoaA/NifB/PqqE/SkfB family radical SAM enzyme
MKTMLTSIKSLLAYKRTIGYLLKKRGIRAVYNFLYIKFFVIAGGEGTGNWIVSRIMEPLFRASPDLATKLTPYPFTVEIEITNRCNKKCTICEHTYWHEPNRDLSFEEFKKIVEQFPKLKWVNLTGEGDSFLNKDYLKMIEYLKKKNIPVFLVDSFDLVDKQLAERLIEIGVDGIWISWDAATKETYEKMKVGCNFEKGLNNIKNLIALKKKMRSPIPELCFRYIVTTLNVHEMPQFIELVHSLGDRGALGDGSGIEFAGLLIFDEVKHLFVEEVPEDILQDTKKEAKELNVHVSFAHSSRSKLRPLERCRAWAEPYIMMGGYVMPCCAVLQNNNRDFLRKHAFGNMLETPFKEIWYSKRYKKFRQMIPKKDEKVPILCRGCRAYDASYREKRYGLSEEI